MNSLIAACNIHGMEVDGSVVTSKNNTEEDFEIYMRNSLGPVLNAYPGK